MLSTQQQWLDQVTPVLETLNQGVIINDDQRRVVFANTTFQEMIKMRAEELVGRPIMELFPPDDIPRLLEFVARRESQGRARYEFYIPQKDGGRLPVAVTSRQVRAADGQPFGIVTATDISEQKSAEMQLLARQRQIEEELQLAERVQQSLAPKSLNWGGVAVEAHYQPVWSIGGDYGLVNPSDDHLDVLVCDVSGHGISSALIANRIYSETMAEIERGAELGSMLRHLNHFVVRHLATSAFYFTLAAARINRSARSLEFAGAGHPPAIVVRSGKSIELLHSKTMVLGLFEDAVDPQPTLQTNLQSGDRILIYTDGLTEVFNSRKEMLGIERLGEIVCRASNLSLQEMKRQVLDAVTDWRSGPATDDVSLVLIEIP